ncbi:MAG TPA: hypothetical protein VG938_16915 [Verrucomicrobiae bacterium]|jgi:hypothetical protein|nr:hypothetical protein [Verrucomicrobiae bacterium]
MPPPCFEVSLLYQDLPTGIHARQFLNHVLDHCQLAAEFSLTLWKLDLFHLPELCEQAVLAACGAALVLLSLRGDLGLDTATENWLAQWVHRRDDDECALAVLIDCDMQRLDSIAQTLFRLQDITRGSQVRLFVGFMPAVPPAKDPSFWQPKFQDADHLLFTPNHGSDEFPIPSEGGLNE